MTGHLTVYIPHRGRDLDMSERIAPGAGIVGTQLADPDLVMIDYEANLHGSSNIVTYADRVYHAASRHTDKYPTVTRSVVRASDLLDIGEWDMATTVLVYPAAVPMLGEWLGIEPTAGLLDPGELIRSDG